jgi:hypothetical protein
MLLTASAVKRKVGSLEPAIIRKLSSTLLTRSVSAGYFTAAFGVSRDLRPSTVVGGAMVLFGTKGRIMPMSRVTTLLAWSILTAAIQGIATAAGDPLPSWNDGSVKRR